MNKIGRNTPCPCGSGKKYKKCCLLRDEKQPQQTKQQPRQELENFAQKRRRLSPEQQAAVIAEFERLEKQERSGR